MKCKQCEEEFEGRADAKYCSPGCRVTANRNKRNTVTDKLPEVVTDKAPGSSDSIGLRYEIVEGEKVYGRQAVRYTKLAEPWDTRPQPDDPLDIPRMNNRGIYTRLDGTSYQIDACGKAHNRNKKGEIYAGKDYLNARKEREAAKDVEVAV